MNALNEMTIKKIFRLHFFVYEFFSVFLVTLCWHPIHETLSRVTQTFSVITRLCFTKRLTLKEETFASFPFISGFLFFIYKSKLTAKPSYNIPPIDSQRGRLRIRHPGWSKVIT